ncbi:type IV pilus modification protein PilV [Acinetobacter beijerinckii]|uniref:type IV pilus modification protein PilV n=1 Tax=Acinetobacter beijerinckii TaxID=262668 RepID=UPI003AF791CB
MNKTTQQGVGLIEVLVALLILALGVLGFAALQLRAMDAAQEATEQTVAMNTARDLVERIRVNRTALIAYQTNINAQTIDSGIIDANKHVSLCVNSTKRDALPATDKINLPVCNPVDMARHDVTEILIKARDHGQTIVMRNCVGATAMSCVYMAWGATVITPTDVSTCVDTTTGTYIVNAKCLVMEAF